MSTRFTVNYATKAFCELKYTAIAIDAAGVVIRDDYTYAVQGPASSCSLDRARWPLLGAVRQCCGSDGPLVPGAQPVSTNHADLLINITGSGYQFSGLKASDWGQDSWAAQAVGPTITATTLHIAAFG